MKSTAYFNLLRRMLLIEILGEALYTALSLKTYEEPSRRIYQKLAANEAHAASCIQREILALGSESQVPFYVKSVQRMAKLVFQCFAEKQLLWILKTVLEKKPYQNWYEKNRKHNPEFWNILLEHENAQQRFLPF